METKMSKFAPSTVPQLAKKKSLLSEMLQSNPQPVVVPAVLPPHSAAPYHGATFDHKLNNIEKPPQLSCGELLSILLDTISIDNTMSDLRLFLVDDDGDADFDLPPLIRSADVIASGMMNFAVVDHASSKEVMKVRLEKWDFGEELGAGRCDGTLSSFGGAYPSSLTDRPRNPRQDSIEEPDGDSHSVDNAESCFVDVNVGDSPEQLPNVMVGKWVGKTFSPALMNKSSERWTIVGVAHNQNSTSEIRLRSISGGLLVHTCQTSIAKPTYDRQISLDSVCSNDQHPLSNDSNDKNHSMRVDMNASNIVSGGESKSVAMDGDPSAATTTAGNGGRKIQVTKINENPCPRYPPFCTNLSEGPYGRSRRVVLEGPYDSDLSDEESRNVGPRGSGSGESSLSSTFQLDSSDSDPIPGDLSKKIPRRADNKKPRRSFGKYSLKLPIRSTSREEYLVIEDSTPGSECVVSPLIRHLSGVTNISDDSESTPNTARFQLSREDSLQDGFFGSLEWSPEIVTAPQPSAYKPPINSVQNFSDEQTRSVRTKSDSFSSNGSSHGFLVKNLDTGEVLPASAVNSRQSTTEVPVEAPKANKTNEGKVSNLNNTLFASKVYPLPPASQHVHDPTPIHHVVVTPSMLYGDGKSKR